MEQERGKKTTDSFLTVQLETTNEEVERNMLAICSAMDGPRNYHT